MTEMQISETVRKTELEGVIQRGLSSFVEVGNALQEIRDARLYRNEFVSFEDYCATRWDFGSNYGYKLIRAAAVVAELPPGSPTPKSVHEALKTPRAKKGASVSHDDVEIPPFAGEDNYFDDRTAGEINMEGATKVADEAISAINLAIVAAKYLSASSSREWLLT